MRVSRNPRPQLLLDNSVVCAPSVGSELVIDDRRNQVAQTLGRNKDAPLHDFNEAAHLRKVETGRHCTNLSVTWQHIIRERRAAFCLHEATLFVCGERCRLRNE